MTEAEKAQYNAMVEALTKEQIKNNNLETEIKRLQERLSRIWYIIDGFEDEI